MADQKWQDVSQNTSPAGTDEVMSLKPGVGYQRVPINNLPTGGGGSAFYYPNSYKPLGTEPIVIVVVGDSNASQSSATPPTSRYPLIANPNIEFWTTDGTGPFPQDPTGCAWRVIDPNDPQPNDWFPASTYIGSRKAGLGNIAWYAADVIQKATNRPVKVYQAAEATTTIGHWIDTNPGGAILLNNTYGIQAALDALPGGDPGGIDLWINVDGTNDSFQGVPADYTSQRFIDDHNDVLATQPTISNARYRSYTESTRSDQAPITPDVYPPYWSGFYLLQQQLGPYETLISSYNVPKSDVFHWSGDGLAMLGIAHGLSYLDGPKGQRIDRGIQTNIKVNQPTDITYDTQEPGIEYESDITNSFNIGGLGATFPPAIQYNKVNTLSNVNGNIFGSGKFLNFAPTLTNAGTSTAMSAFQFTVNQQKYTATGGGVVNMLSSANALVSAPSLIIDAPTYDTDDDGVTTLNVPATRSFASQPFFNAGVDVEWRITFESRGSNLSGGGSVDNEVHFGVQGPMSGNQNAVLAHIDILSDQIPTGTDWFIYQGNSSTLPSLFNGTVKLRPFVGSGDQNLIVDNNGDIQVGSAAISAAATSWAESLADSFDTFTQSTNNSSWVEVYRDTKASGFAESGKIRWKANRTDAIDFSEKEWGWISWYNGGVLVDDQSALFGQLGNGSVDCRIRADGADLVIEVMGNAGEDWDHTVIFCNRDIS